MSWDVIIEKAKKVKILMLDVDGVMTDGSIYYDGAGESIKVFNVHDGSAIVWLQRAGFEVALLSGRECASLLARAKDLGIKTVMANAKIKLPVFKDYLERTGVDPETIAFMGDDLFDLTVLRRVGLSLAPADAAQEVKDEVDWVAGKPGGRGAVREACELILKATGKWEEITARYYE